ncbi:hypothetical protein NIES4073_80610 [Kalymmatonema gypsitolerans NIES-4073]|nr:hypothetical protein NIES4073_80610 [Scytonema sp. NIES-4073]
MFEVSDRLLKASHTEVLAFFGDVYLQVSCCILLFMSKQQPTFITWQ